MTHRRVKRFIKTVRESFEGSEEVYTRGSCYRFYLILKDVFPTAICYYDQDHVITRIGKRYYDITGEVKRGRHLPIVESRRLEMGRLRELKYSMK